MGDPVFAVKNGYYLGAYQAAINEGSDMEELNELESVERDYFTYRSYIAQGSCQVCEHDSPIDRCCPASAVLRICAGGS